MVLQEFIKRLYVGGTLRAVALFESLSLYSFPILLSSKKSRAEFEKKKKKKKKKMSRTNFILEDEDGGRWVKLERAVGVYVFKGNATLRQLSFERGTALKVFTHYDNGWSLARTRRTRDGNYSKGYVPTDFIELGTCRLSGDRKNEQNNDDQMESNARRMSMRRPPPRPPAAVVDVDQLPKGLPPSDNFVPGGVELSPRSQAIRNKKKPSFAPPQPRVRRANVNSAPTTSSNASYRNTVAFSRSPAPRGLPPKPLKCAPAPPPGSNVDEQGQEQANDNDDDDDDEEEEEEDPFLKTLRLMKMKQGDVREQKVLARGMPAPPVRDVPVPPSPSANVRIDVLRMPTRFDRLLGDAKRRRVNLWCSADFQVLWMSSKKSSKSRRFPIARVNHASRHGDTLSIYMAPSAPGKAKVKLSLAASSAQAASDWCDALRVLTDNDSAPVPVADVLRAKSSISAAGGHSRAAARRERFVDSTSASCLDQRLDVVASASQRARPKRSRRRARSKSRSSSRSRSPQPPSTSKRHSDKT
jgi:hypothetical protein